MLLISVIIKNGDNKMIDWLVIWGVTQAAGFVFKPILEDLPEEIKDPSVCGWGMLDCNS